MKWVSLAFAVGSTISGVIAALYWFKASKVDFRPHWEIDGKLILVPTTEVETWINSVRKTLGKSGGLNAVAARWSAVSIFLAGVASLFGALSN